MAQRTGYGAEMHPDADFFGLTPADGSGTFRFRVENRLARLDGHLYGGTAIAVSIVAGELVSGRPVRWMTTQFVATAAPDAEITVTAEVLAPGRRTNQLRVTGTDGSGAVMFASLGASGLDRSDGLHGTFENPPGVDPPEDSEPWSSPFRAMVRHAGVELDLPEGPNDLGFNSVVEFREPSIRTHPDPGPGRICMWVRRRDDGPFTPALAAFVADMVPLSVAAACGVLAGGVSLDNSIRIGEFPDTDWVLLDLRPHLATSDYGHGAAHLWSRDGRLLATASQSASMIRFDPSAFPFGPGD